MRSHIKNVVAILAGAFVMASGINYFTISNHLAEGGFTGISILANYLFGVSPALVYFVLNLPLLVAGWRALGAVSMAYTALGVVSTAGFLRLTQGFSGPLGGDYLLAALYSGVSIGLGLGIILRYGGTSGGSDIIARLVERKHGWSVGRTLFVFDLLVIGASIPIIGRERALYTLVSVFLGGRVVDYVQEASYGGKAVFVVSKHAASISKAIHYEMERGTTMLVAKGGYTEKEQHVVYCVVARHELARLKDIVHRCDPDPFMVVSDAIDVVGEGFTYNPPE